MERIRSTSEVASGTINGTNKVFTVVNAIVTISGVQVDGSPYAQYTFTGSTITLDDAPTTGSVLVTYTYESNIDYLDNSGWIAGEVMDGEVDSNNKIFTASYPIGLVDELRVNGTPTSAYIIRGKTIKLTTAPTTGTVVIDYFRKDFFVRDYSSDTYYTLGEVRSKVYNKLGQEEDSVQYPSAIVDEAILDGVSEIVSTVADKSRFVTYSIQSAGCVRLTNVENELATISIVSRYTIPYSGRLITSRGDIINYSAFDGSTITTDSYMSLTSSNVNGFVGYRLPRNIKRVVDVYVNGFQAQNAGSPGNFLFNSGGYFISGGYIYLSSNLPYTLEVELSENITTSEDDTIVYIDKDDVSVVIYYALKHLYADREDDRLANTAELYKEKLKSYKRKIAKKRSSSMGNVMKTAGFDSNIPKITNLNRIIESTVEYIDDVDGGTAYSEY